MSVRGLGWRAWRATPRTLDLVALLLCSSCMPAWWPPESPPLMIPEETPIPAPAPGRAIVVFLRPSSLLGSARVRIFDDQLRFVGVSRAGGHFAVEVAPGLHWFYAFTLVGSALQAEVAPNKTYFVVVRPGNWQPPGPRRRDGPKVSVHLAALAPGDEEWDERADWIEDSTRHIPDTAAGQIEFDMHSDDLQERIVEAREIWDEWSKHERGLHQLSAADGI